MSGSIRVSPLVFFLRGSGHFRVANNVSILVERETMGSIRVRRFLVLSSALLLHVMVHSSRELIIRPIICHD